MEAPLTQYALRDGVHIGYQVWGQAPAASGDGPVDVLEFNSGLMISVDETVDEPNWLRYTERVADFSRLIRFDAGGLGLSDPLPTDTDPSIEGWGRDALAVMDAAGCDRVVVLASAGGTMPALWLAATHPERVISLIIVNGTARVGRAEDYGFGASDEEVAAGSGIEGTVTDDGIPRDIAIFAPSLAHRIGFREWWGRAARRGASPATAQAFNLVTFSADVRWTLPSVTCPVLVFARLDSYAQLSEHGRYLSEHIAGARLITTTGPDILPWAGEFDSIIDEMEEFVTGSRGVHAATRLLAAVLFTDIVDSTVRAAAVGDRQWRAVLDEFDVNVGRLLERNDGTLVKNMGDGILARFAAPAQAVRCAVAMVRMAGTAGLQLRAGLHAGEVELRGDDIGGLAVHIASRVATMAGPGEVLVTGTVRDLVVGSGIVFDDRGRHNLKGLPDEWQVLAVERAPESVSEPHVPRRRTTKRRRRQTQIRRRRAVVLLSLVLVVAALVVTLASGSSSPPTRSSTSSSSTTAATGAPTTASADGFLGPHGAPLGPRHSKPALSLGSSPPRSPGRRSSLSGAGSAFSVACPPKGNSLNAVSWLDPASGTVTAAGSLAAVVHDGAGAQIGTASYVFGGGSPNTFATVQSLGATAGGRDAWPANCHSPARTSPPPPSGAPSTSWAATTAPPTIPRS